MNNVQTLKCKYDYSNAGSRIVKIEHEDDLNEPFKASLQWPKGELVMQIEGKVLGITIERGFYWVGYYTIEEAEVYSLLSGKGGQGFEQLLGNAVPRRYLVSSEQALVAAKEFYRMGTVDLKAGWELYVGWEDEQEGE